MTQDKARKIAARQRMAETGEPYSVAMRAVQSGQPDRAAAGQDPESHAASAYTVTAAGLVTTAGESSTGWDEEYYADGAAIKASPSRSSRPARQLTGRTAGRKGQWAAGQGEWAAAEGEWAAAEGEWAAGDGEWAAAEGVGGWPGPGNGGPG